ncbi:MAG: FtsQ-type POTRA domain-containing protein [Clostridiales bacterium]|jgi:cell division septal protein FtsQ|nr:FtsQ-type POTRA domain-containing protein [Clostridiales bacterium]
MCADNIDIQLKKLYHKQERLSYYPKRGPLSIKAKAAIVIAACILTALSPLFRIRNIEITGNQALSEEMVLQALGLTKSVNILFYNTRSAVRNIQKNQFLEKITLRKIPPSTISVNIQERQVCGYVPYMGSYLFIDKDGRVIHISSSFQEELPLVVGLRFSGFHLGELLEVNNQDAFDIIVILTRLFQKYELDDQMIGKMDVSDVNDVHLTAYNIDVAIGGLEDADAKIRTLKEIILHQLPNAPRVKGSLDIREIGGQYIFKALT